MTDEDYRAALDAYRKHLVLAEQDAVSKFDQSVIAIASGALGLSFVFLENLVGSGTPSHQWLLFLSWVLWAVSILLILFSFFCSQKAMQKAIRDLDEELSKAPSEEESEDDEPHTPQRAGGRWANANDTLTIAGGIALFIGFIAMGIFVYSNLDRSTNERQEEARSAPAFSSPSASSGREEGTGIQPPSPPSEAAAGEEVAADSALTEEEQVGEQEEEP